MRKLFKLFECLEAWYNRHFVTCAECDQGQFYEDGSSALAILVDRETKKEQVLCIKHLYANPDFAKTIT